MKVRDILETFLYVDDLDATENYLRRGAGV